MDRRQPSSLSRRKAVAGGLAALALGFARPDRTDARVLFLRGMAGGGLAKLDGGEEPRLANLSLAASAMQFPEGNTLFLGRIQWIEAGTGLALASTEVSQCIPIEGRSDGAEIRGRMSVNGEGSYPFVIEAFDTGLPGSGQDAITIEVNGPKGREGDTSESQDSEFTYEARAPLVAGDFAWVIADAELPG